MAGDSARAALGAMDIVSNNVGAILRGNPEGNPVAEWERMMGHNFMGTVQAQALFFLCMIEQFAASVSGRPFLHEEMAHLNPAEHRRWQ